MKGGLIGLVLVLSLALLACDGSGRKIFFNGRLSHTTSNTVKSSNESPRIGVKGGVVHGCKSRKVGLCDLFNKIDKNITLDDKRVVPTGPNPLHNRRVQVDVQCKVCGEEVEDVLHALIGCRVVSQC
ncbi:hypothetical protein Sjap_022913 [Stephania japonica]|uniref:Uncharacterized protein n=1 Tax=Stephania japonica TaxID=461633 RepID=A0AAP0EPT1_9MAGN